MIKNSPTADSLSRRSATPDQLNKWKWLILSFTVLLIFAAAFWFYMTPYLALGGMRRAAQNRNAEEFSSYIDFPDFKENLKSELSAKMMAETVNNQNDLENNPFAPLALTLASSLVNSVVDALVSPAGIERLMRGEFGLPDAQNESASQTPKSKFPDEETHDIAAGYESLNKFSVQAAPKGKPDQRVKLVMERRGLFGWQVTSLKLP